VSSVRIDAKLIPKIDAVVKRLKYWRSRREFIEDAIRRFIGLS